MILDIAEAVAELGGCTRKESRGAHTCKRLPERATTPTTCYHSLMLPTIPTAIPSAGEEGEVTLGTWEPEERKY